MKLIKGLVIALTLMVTQTAMAKLPTPWTFEVTPYLWLLNMNGNVGVGPLNSHIDETTGDIFKHLDFGAMIYGSAHRDRFGLYGSVLYADLSDSGNFGPIHIKATNHYGIFGAGLSYIVYKRQLTWKTKISVEPYAGARYTINNTNLKIAGFSVNDNQHWTDPVVGMQVDFAMNRRWSIRAAGDVGGTNTTTHYSYSALALLGYTPQDFWTNTTFSLGYRVLGQHYQHGSGFNFYNWDMRLFGPMAAVTIRF